MNTYLAVPSVGALEMLVRDMLRMPLNRLMLDGYQVVHDENRVLLVWDEGMPIRRQRKVFVVEA